ncbi:hypothetical protein [Micromonospora sp. CB01531]|nr:hypothetical protein [Micromonospora sp. CB01531]
MTDVRGPEQAYNFGLARVLDGLGVLIDGGRGGRGRSGAARPD